MARITGIGLLTLLVAGIGACKDDGAGKDSAQVAGTVTDRDGDGAYGDQDCDDTDPDVFQGAPEVCDEKDNDCNGEADDGALDAGTWYVDGDGDGDGDADNRVKGCSRPENSSVTSDDCDDGDAAYNPGAEETDCSDPNDYNCDGSVGYADLDRDGYAACEECDDYSANTNPGAVESCDDEDDDCNGVVDDNAVDAPAVYADADGDGYGAGTSVGTACAAGEGQSLTADDCSDEDTAFHPGAEESDCADPNDYNCDGSTGYADADGDGYGACEECDDADPALNPAAEDVCDGVDNNCDGTVDDGSAGALTWYLDLDGDLYGDDASPLTACTQPTGFVAVGGDCNDADTAYNPGAAETDCADTNDYNCDGASGFTDADGDGYAACAECDDGDATINPAGVEVCDGVDNDCDGTIDVAATDGSTWFADADLDGYGLADTALVACTQPEGYVAVDGDCDASNNTIYPGAAESCNDVDDNCDGSVDEGAAGGPWYADADEDGFGDPTVQSDACEVPVGYSADGTDCDDANDRVNPSGEEVDCADPTDYNCDGFSGAADSDGDSFAACEECDDGDASVNPDAIEVCDGVDNDCDRTADGESAIDSFLVYPDADGDGYGDDGAGAAACEVAEGTSLTAGDCDDTDSSVSPDAVEFCDGDDDDCDGIVDNDAINLVTSYADTDGDGYGDAANTTVGCSVPAGSVADSSDCDDTDVTVNPDALELCDEVDNDCDGSTDESDAADATFWYADADEDGYGDATLSGAACDQPEGFVADADDCDDSAAAINPGADELCNGLDDNCDGLADDGAVDGGTWYVDSDDDGSGDTATGVSSCDAPVGYVSDGGDCDDDNAGINPDATEVCDASDTDEDCDNAADDDDDDATGGEVAYADADADSYGSLASPATFCDRPAGYVTDSSDCDDGDPAINPAAVESCDAGNTDEDCDGLADNDDPSAIGASRTTFYADVDADSYGNASSSDSFCDQPSGYVANSTDCNDGNAAINPAATEVCDASNTDEDCDLLADDNDPGVASGGRSTWYRDADTDTYGSATTTSSACDQPAGYVGNSTDCNDASATINPAATEVCDAANTDEDCDLLADNNDTSAAAAGKTTFYADADADTYGSSATSAAFCDLPSGYAGNSTDCNDSNVAINPGATEICDAADTDEDCDLLADDDDSSVSTLSYSTFYRDADADSYGTAATTTSACDLPRGYLSNSTDCNDSNAAINPAATEVCDTSNTDEDCDGVADDFDSSVSAAGFTTFYADTDGDGYGDPADAEGFCDVGSGYVPDNTDCDDDAGTTYPGATEICRNGEDDGCDGVDDCIWTGSSNSITDADVTLSGEKNYATGTGFFGGSAAAGKDLTGDGIADLMIADRNWDYSSSAGANTGRAYLIAGSASGITASVTSPTARITGGLTATDSGDGLGQGLGMLDDINGDGYDELLLGRFKDNDPATDAGSAYLFSGVSLVGTSLGVSNASVTIIGSAGSSSTYPELTGWTLDQVADADGDDLADWVVSSYMYGGSGASARTGRVTIVPSSLAAGSYSASAAEMITVINGAAANDRFGGALVGDVDADGDGIGDLLVSAPTIGTTYIFSGPVSSATSASAADYTMTGVSQTINSNAPYETNCGSCIAGAGDNNNDGYEDLVLGADATDVGFLADAGAAYMINGPVTTNLSMSADADFRINGVFPYDFVGRSVDGAGDVDGDGFDDLLIGASGVDIPSSLVGIAAVVYGPASGTASLISTNIALFAGTVSASNLGSTVLGLGDMNDDGFDDFLFSAPNSTTPTGGTSKLGMSYLYYGTAE